MDTIFLPSTERTAAISQAATIKVEKVLNCMLFVKSERGKLATFDVYTISIYNRQGSSSSWLSGTHVSEISETALPWDQHGLQ